MWNFHNLLYRRRTSDQDWSSNFAMKNQQSEAIQGKVRSQPKRWW